MSSLSNKQRDDITRALERSFGYSARRAAEMFFPVWEKDRSFDMFFVCARQHGLSKSQELEAVECMRRHGIRLEEFDNKHGG